MGAPPLVNTDVENGRAAIEAIKRAQIPVRQAFWAYFLSAEEWRLVIITPLVDQKGPLAAYADAQRALAAAGELPLRRIVVAGTADPLIKLLADAPKSGGRVTAGPVTVVN